MKTQKENAEIIAARVKNEFEQYKTQLMRKHPEDIVESTYQTMIYLELLSMLDSREKVMHCGAEPDQLLSLPESSILDTLYYEWLKSDIQSDLRDCLSAVMYRKFGPYK